MWAHRATACSVSLSLSLSLSGLCTVFQSAPTGTEWGLGEDRDRRHLANEQLSPPVLEDNWFQMINFTCISAKTLGLAKAIGQIFAISSMISRQILQMPVRGGESTLKYPFITAHHGVLAFSPRRVSHLSASMSGY